MRYRNKKQTSNKNRSDDASRDEDDQVEPKTLPHASARLACSSACRLKQILKNSLTPRLLQQTTSANKTHVDVYRREHASVYISTYVRLSFSPGFSGIFPDFGGAAEG